MAQQRSAPLAHRDGRPHSYRLAARWLVVESQLEPLAALAAFERQDGRDSVQPCPPIYSEHTASLHPIYRGPGWLGNRWRGFACWSSTAGYRLEIEGVGEYSISPEGNLVRLERAESGAEVALAVEAMLGPALILALTLQGTYCLHASAASFDGQVVAFAGESGNGKSTLAAFLGAGEAERWRHVADDILPVELRAGHLEALPHFPQLKLPTDEQPAAGLPERLPIGALYVLSRAAAGQTGVELGPMSRQEATLALVRHTVAARLFDPDLLARHLAFCGGAASAIPVRRLAYAHEPASLPRAREALAADLRVLTLPTPRGCHG